MMRPQGGVVRTIRRAYSDDGALTWELFSYDIPGTDADPMTAYDSVTSTLLVGALTDPGRLFYTSRKQPSDNEFTDAVVVDGEGTDKIWMAAGPKPTGGSRMYLAGGVSVDGPVIWSDDLGNTWSDAIDFDNFGGALLPRIGTGGELFIAGGFVLTQEFGVIRALSLDQNDDPIFLSPDVVADQPNFGTSSLVPGTFRHPNYLILAVDPHDPDLIYAVYFDKSGDDPNGNVNIDLFFTKSTNGTDPNGSTWSTPVLIPEKENGQPVALPGDQFFPWLEVDSDGKLHLLFMDSRHNPDQLDQNPNGDPSGLFDMYYVFSEDEVDNWTQFRLTPDSFDVADAGNTVMGSQDFWGDYMGMAVAGKRIYPFYPAINGNPTAAEAHTNYIVLGDASELDDFNVAFGSLQAGNLNSLAQSDDDRLTVRTGPPLIPGGPVRNDVRVGLTAPFASASDIDLRIETSASIGGVTGIVRLKNWVTDNFDLVNTYSVSTADDVVEIRGIRAAHYIRASDDRIELQFEHSGQPLTPGGSIDSRYDQVRVVVLED